MKSKFECIGMNSKRQYMSAVKNIFLFWGIGRLKNVHLHAKRRKRKFNFSRLTFDSNLKTRKSQ
jgi:hypothetical protein